MKRFMVSAVVTGVMILGGWPVPSRVFAKDGDTIVGTWKQVFSIPERNTEYQTTYVFKADGTGYSQSWNNQTGKSDGPNFKWRKGDGNKYFQIKVVKFNVGTEDEREKIIEEPITLLDGGNRIRFPSGGNNPADDYFNRVK